MAAEIGEFVKAVVVHWGAWLTGGLIIAAISVYEHFKADRGLAFARSYSQPLQRTGCAGR